MQDRIDYLLGLKATYERCLLNAVDERNAIAIYELEMKVNEELFQLMAPR